MNDKFDGGEDVLKHRARRKPCFWRENFYEVWLKQFYSSVFHEKTGEALAWRIVLLKSSTNS